MPPRAMLRAFVGAVLCLAAGVMAGCGGGQSAPAATDDASLAATPPPAPQAPSPSPSPSPSPIAQALHTVAEGDTLDSIAQQYYGDSTLWRKIFDANKAVIGDNPDNIKIGMQLTIPPKD
jgi:5'-nucleotidase / UDP-sugar diphosphatase